MKIGIISNIFRNKKVVKIHASFTLFYFYFASWKWIAIFYPFATKKYCFSRKK